jgi:hypothetical protein
VEPEERRAARSGGTGWVAAPPAASAEPAATEDASAPAAAAAAAAAPAPAPTPASAVGAALAAVHASPTGGADSLATLPARFLGRAGSGPLPASCWLAGATGDALRGSSASLPLGSSLDSVLPASLNAAGVLPDAAASATVTGAWDRGPDGCRPPASAPLPAGAASLSAAPTDTNDEARLLLLPAVVPWSWPASGLWLWPSPAGLWWRRWLGSRCWCRRAGASGVGGAMGRLDMAWAEQGRHTAKTHAQPRTMSSRGEASSHRAWAHVGCKHDPPRRRRGGTAYDRPSPHEFQQCGSDARPRPRSPRRPYWACPCP